ncbi:MAG TPA: MauE/DoxX family redox-associated membrane protein [Jatrophihabitantaceae bacterium]
MNASESRLASNWPMLRPWIGTVARLVLAVVWIWAAVSKLSDPRVFVQAVRAYDATPEWLSKGIGYGMPVLELCLGVVLVIGITTRIAACVSAFLLTVFLIGIIQAAVRGISIECGCFGGGGTTTSTTYTWDIIRDVLLLCAAVYLIIWPLTHWSMEYYLARQDYVAPPSAKRMRTPEGRRRYEAQLAVKAANSKSRSLYINSSIVIVVVLVSLIGIGVQANRARIANVTSTAAANAVTGVVWGKKAAAVVDIYEDFGCPVCEQFEQQTHAKLQEQVRANLAQVRYHPIAILDASSPNQYSSRAANAALCASDISSDMFVAYHNILFGKDASGKQVQPEEGTPGPTNTQLIGFGKQAGMTTAQLTTFTDCVTSNQYKPLVEALTDNASKRGVSGTPTIFVNNKKLPNHDPDTLFNAIAAANKGHTPAPSKTPSPTVSPSGSASPSASPSPSPSATASATPSPSS